MQHGSTTLSAGGGESPRGRRSNPFPDWSPPLPQRTARATIAIATDLPGSPNRPDISVSPSLTCYLFGAFRTSRVGSRSPVRPRLMGGFCLLQLLLRRGSQLLVCNPRLQRDNSYRELASGAPPQGSGGGPQLPRILPQSPRGRSSDPRLSAPLSSHAASVSPRGPEPRDQGI